MIRDLKIKSYTLINSQNHSNNLGGGTETNHKNKKLFTDKPTWEPPLNLTSLSVQDTIKNIEKTTSETLRYALQKEQTKNKEVGGDITQLPDPLVHNFFHSLTNYDKNNLSITEISALRELKTNKDIIIKSADKGGGVVVMDRTAYKAEALRQLQDTTYYTEITTSLAPQNTTYIRKVTDTLLKSKYITKSQHKYLTGPEDYSPRTFYLLPKIHKPIEKWTQPGIMPQGRPIVSDSNSESCRIAEYIDHFIKPLANTNSAFLKNSYDFVNKVRNKNFPPGYLLVTADVKSLYTNMHIDRMVQSVQTAFAEHPDPTRPDKEIIELLDYTLRHNDFTFDNKQYLQVCGCAMGKSYSPSLANIYLQSFDEAAKNNFEIKPELYFRYLDDIHFIWGGGVDKLLEYQDYLNTLIPGIEVTFEYNNTEIPFLDVLLYAQNNTIQTRTYFKPTDTHQLLHMDSYHPKHTCKGILKSQLIRFARLSSTYEDYHRTTNILLNTLKHRGYTYSLLRKFKFDVWKTHGPDSTQNLTTPPPTTGLIPIIMNYSSLGDNLTRSYKRIINNEYTMNKFKKITAYKGAPNLKQLLVRSNFSENTNKGSHTITQQETGCFLTCTSNRCRMCKLNAHPATTITSYSNKKQYNIIGNLTCNSSNVIYVISCVKCNIQYVGETGQIIRDRLNNHYSTIRTNKPTRIATHFTNNHDRTDMICIPVEKINEGPDQTSTRKLRELDWIKKLDTKYPRGLNGLPPPI